jgi:hypothetical protein
MLVVFRSPRIHTIILHERWIPSIAPQPNRVQIVQSADFIPRRSLLRVQELVGPYLQRSGGIDDLHHFDTL